MDIQKMIKEAESMQKSLLQVQAELEKIIVTGKSGNGLVEIIMNAQGDLKNVKIKPEAINSGDVETLEDLVLTAFKDAFAQATKVSQEKLSKLGGPKGIPPF